MYSTQFSIKVISYIIHTLQHYKVYMYAFYVIVHTFYLYYNTLLGIRVIIYIIAYIIML